jgi:hypothetical protein
LNNRLSFARIVPEIRRGDLRFQFFQFSTFSRRVKETSRAAGPGVLVLRIWFVNRLIQSLFVLSDMKSDARQLAINITQRTEKII